MNIMIVGVGGQGSLLASRLIGALYLQRGKEVKVSEVHGMSQRGGSVVTYVKADDSVASPLIESGEADLIIAFEQLEALRYLHYLKKTGAIALSTQIITPMPVITGAAAYPENIVDTIRQTGVAVLAIDALRLAIQAGSPKAANVVMMGAASGLLDFQEDEWQTALAQIVKPKFLEMNQKAFALGKGAQA